MTSKRIKAPVQDEVTTAVTATAEQAAAIVSRMPTAKEIEETSEAQDTPMNKVKNLETAAAKDAVKALQENDESTFSAVSKVALRLCLEQVRSKADPLHDEQSDKYVLNTFMFRFAFAGAMVWRYTPEIAAALRAMPEGTEEEIAAKEAAAVRYVKQKGSDGKKLPTPKNLTGKDSGWKLPKRLQTIFTTAKKLAEEVRLNHVDLIADVWNASTAKAAQDIWAESIESRFGLATAWDESGNATAFMLTFDYLSDLLDGKAAAKGSDSSEGSEPAKGSEGGNASEGSEPAAPEEPKPIMLTLNSIREAVAMMSDDDLAALMATVQAEQAKRVEAALTAAAPAAPEQIAA